MFHPEEREAIRAELLDLAENDLRFGGGAVTGSASVDKLDEWSDIDLAFGVNDPEEIPKILNEYTERMYGRYRAVHHLDVVSGCWVYRVFFLESSLQVDLAFVAQKEFGARAPSFKLVFGKSNSFAHDKPASAETTIGKAWLCALHVRSSIKRGRLWQGEHMLNAMRNEVISLCCLRHDLPEKQGRGVDRLPDELKLKLGRGLVNSIRSEDLQLAFEAVTDIFLDEIATLGDERILKLGPVLRELTK